MRITVKTAGLLSKHLPPGSRGSSAQIEVADDASPRDVIAALGLPPDENYLVSLNDTIVPPSERASRKLAENDRLAILPPLKAG